MNTKCKLIFFMIFIIRINMSCCSATYDNKNCPLKMSDGRFFTNYQTRCARNADLNSLLTKNNMINSSYEQRLFLQRNYEMVVENERNRLLNQLLPCIPCNKGELINEKNPELENKNRVYCDNVTCYNTNFNEKGLGITQGF